MGCGSRMVHCFSLVAFLGFLLAVGAAADGDIYLAGVEGRLCNSSIAGCLAGVEELEMDSEVSRRSLQMMKPYLGYRAVKRPQAPAPGPAKSGNRYGRGCSGYTRCRGASYTPP